MSQRKGALIVSDNQQTKLRLAAALEGEHDNHRNRYHSMWTAPSQLLDLGDTVRSDISIFVIIVTEAGLEIDLVRKIREHHKATFILVLGCDSQRSPQLSQGDEHCHVIRQDTTMTMIITYINRLFPLHTHVQKH